MSSNETQQIHEQTQQHSTKEQTEASLPCPQCNNDNNRRSDVQPPQQHQQYAPPPNHNILPHQHNSFSSIPPQHHQQQYVPQQQQQQPLYQESYHPPYQYGNHDHTESSTTTLAAAVTAGSLLGLSAAAAVRWLNGGDFTLFPAAIPGSSISPASVTSMALECGPTTKDRSSDEADHRLAMEQQIEQLVGIVERQSEQQEQVTKRLQATLNEHQANIATNKSMDLLRTQPPVNHDDFLREIRNDLAVLQTSVNASTPVKRSLSTIVTKIEGKLGLSDTTLEDESSFLRKSDGEVQSALTSSVLHLETASRDNTALERSALSDAIRQLVNENEISVLRKGAQLLYLYTINVKTHPRVPRYRKIFATNESFQQHVVGLEGVKDLLGSLGFVEREQSNKNIYWEWMPVEIEGNPALEPLEFTEDVYLQRLNAAAAALEVLKSAGLNETKSAIEKNSLIAAGFESFSRNAVAECANTTPQRQCKEEMCANAAVSQQGTPTNNAVFQTPESGSILSPPVTKKSTPPVDFPLLDTMDDNKIQATPNLVSEEKKSGDPRETVNSISPAHYLKPVRELDGTCDSDSSYSHDSTNDAGEAAMWK